MTRTAGQGWGRPFKDAWLALDVLCTLVQADQSTVLHTVETPKYWIVQVVVRGVGSRSSLECS